MKKSFTRVLAMLTVLSVAVMILASANGFIMTAEAASAPMFSLQANVSSAKSGDIVTVSLFVTNRGEAAITSFDGDITFNSSHFNYIDFIYPDNMRDKLTCLDYNATSSSKISITFADTTKLLVPAGASNVLVLQLRFMVVSTVAGTGQVICSINNCYSGMTKYSDIAPTQFSLPVSPTQPTQSTTTSYTTTTTTRQRSSDARLNSLGVAPGMLSPTFNPEFVAYNVSVEYEVATIRISATANSSAAVVSGVGVKDLAVGQNTFTVTVTAEDGSVMQYGIVVTRAQETQSSVDVIIDTPSSTETTSTTTMAPIYSEPTTLPTTTTTQPLPDKIIEGNDNAVTDESMVKVLGIVFAEVALFMFGFLAGFFLDKNLRKKNLAEAAISTMERQQQMRRPPQQMPPMPIPRQPEYQPQEYQENYQETYPEYNNFPQYDGYDEPQYDEYGNPIDNSQYGGYYDNNDTFYN